MQKLIGVVVYAFWNAKNCEDFIFYKIMSAFIIKCTHQKMLILILQSKNFN